MADDPCKDGHDEWVEIFVNAAKGGPGYQTVCRRCWTPKDSRVLTVNEALAVQRSRVEPDAQREK